MEFMDLWWLEVMCFGLLSPKITILDEHWGVSHTTDSRLNPFPEPLGVDPQFDLMGGYRVTKGADLVRLTGGVVKGVEGEGSGGKSRSWKAANLLRLGLLRGVDGVEGLGGVCFVPDAFGFG